MMTRCIADGLSAAARQWRLAVLLWVCGLVAASIVMWPTVSWWRDLVGYAPEADRMIEGIRLGVLVELLRGENLAGWRVLAGTAIAVLLAARIAHAFVIGGVVHLLASPGDALTPDGALRARSLAYDGDGLVAAGTERSRIPEREQITAHGMAGDEAERRAGHEASAALAMAPEVPGLPLPGSALAEPEFATAELASPESASPELASPELATAGSASPDVIAIAPATSTATANRRPGGEHGVLPRFFGGGARFFVRNLVILLVNGIAAVLIGLLFRAAGRAMVRPLDDTLSASLAWARLLLPLALPGLVVFFFLLVNDYAAIRLVVSDSRRPIRTWLSALGFVARQFVGSASIWMIVGLMLGLVLSAYVAFRVTVPATTWPVIALMVVIQQAFMLVRATLRIATVSAELNYATELGFVSVLRGADSGPEGPRVRVGEQAVASSLPLSSVQGERAM